MSAPYLPRLRGLAPARTLPYPRLPSACAEATSRSASAAPMAWLPRAVLLHRQSALLLPSPICCRAPTLSTLRAAAADPSAPAARLAHRSSFGAAEARRRSREKRWRRTRSHAKRTMWREIELQTLACSAMCAGCDDTSSDDDDDKTGNGLIAPVLLAGLSDVDELKIAWTAGSPRTSSRSLSRNLFQHQLHHLEGAPPSTGVVNLSTDSAGMGWTGNKLV